LDSSIYLWDLGSSRPIKKMTGHQGQITSLSFSAESSVLVSGSLDSTVRCWDVKSAGGEKSSSMRDESDAASRRASGVNHVEMGELPLGPGRDTWEEGTKQTYVPRIIASE
jgi:transcription initiation factor TFIID subunit 5